MDKLLAYINALSFAERDVFAAEIGTSIGYLRKAVSAGDKLRESLCMDIERVSSGKVTCEDLRPDLAEQWAYMRGSRKTRKAA